MDNQPATNSSRSLLARFWPWLMVLIVLLFVGYIRVRLLEMPLERDEGEYAYAGQLLLQGIPPYELAYNMKLPGTYFTYALGMAVFGQTTAGIHLTLLVANSLTIVFVFLLGRKLFGVTAGLAACASYAVMSVSPAVLGMEAHANHFVVLFAVPATLLLWQAEKSKRLHILFFSGLLYGLAFVMKQQGVCFILFGYVFLVWREIQRKPVVWLDFVKRSFVFGLGIILPFAITCLVLAWAGVFSKFWFWTFTYASSYVVNEPLWEGIGLLCNYLRITLTVYFGFLVLAALGLLFSLRNTVVQKQKVFGVIFLFFSFFGTATGLYFRQHYFILSLPAFAILIGLGVDSLCQVLRSRMAKVVSLMLFVAVLGWAIWVSRAFYFQMSPIQVCRVLYQDSPFVESLAVAKYIREHSSENASIAVMGSEPEIYFYAQRHSATGYIYSYALMEEQPNAPKMQQEMIHEIEAGQPEYLVWVGYKKSWLIQPSSDLAIFHWFDQYAGDFYERVGVIHVRSTGEIEDIWNVAAKKHYDFPDYIAVYKRKSLPEANAAK
jgi:4-amino-4-deoxy-L-arabinose transferase-like glycosyltransferase